MLTIEPISTAWTLEELQKALSDIVKNKNRKIENKREKDPSVLSRLSQLFLVIPMAEAGLDGTLDKDEYWTVENRIVEVPRPRNIDGVYVVGDYRPDGSGHGRYPVSEVRLAK
ncbi:MAG: hypothetical protein OXH92_02290 [Bryobacterales bacterium]|nr:hypothetical protein [Bryobacterales bacterium]MDE0432816.1 hypothetical protein [Bryobacterales bacterium]